MSITIDELTAMVHAHFPGASVALKSDGQHLLGFISVVVDRRLIKIPVFWLLTPASAPRQILLWLRHQLKLDRAHVLRPCRARGHITRRRCHPLEYGQLEGAYVSAVEEAKSRVKHIYKREPRHVHLCRDDLCYLTIQWGNRYGTGFEPSKALGLPVYIVDKGDVSWVD